MTDGGTTGGWIRKTTRLHTSPIVQHEYRSPQELPTTTHTRVWSRPLRIFKRQRRSTDIRVSFHWHLRLLTRFISDSCARARAHFTSHWLTDDLYAWPLPATPRVRVEVMWYTTSRDIVFTDTVPCVSSSSLVLGMLTGLVFPGSWKNFPFPGKNLGTGEFPEIAYNRCL